MITFITKPFKYVSALIAQSSNALSYIIIGIIVFLGPLFFFPVRGLSITASKGYFVALCTIIGLLVAGITVLKRGLITLPKGFLFVVLGALSLMSLISAFFSQSFGMALIGYGFETTTWFFVTAFGLLALFAYKTIKQYDRIGLIYGGIVLSFIVLAIIHIIRFFAGPATANLGVLGTTTSTLIGSWTDLGIFAGIVLLVTALTLQLAGLVRFAKWIAISLAAVATVFLLVMNMYTVWVVVGLLALLLTLYLFAFAYWDSSSKTYKKEKRVPWYVLTLFIVSLVGIFFGGLINGVVSRYQNIVWNDIRPAFGTTMQVAQKSIKHNPVAGHGPNSFMLGWSLAKPPALSGNTLADAEFALGYSYFTTQIAMNGLVGAILWITLLITVVYGILRRMSQGFQTALERYFVISLAVTILFLMVMAIVAVPGSYLLALLAIAIGAFYGSFIPHKEKSISFIKDPRASFFGILGVTLLIIATLIGGYIVLRKIVSFMHDTRGLVLMTNQKYPEAAAEISKAVAYASHDLYHVQLAQLALGDAGKLISGLNDTNRQAISGQAEQVLGIALGNAKAATAQNPLSYKNWVLLGNVYRAAVSLGVKDAYSLGVAAYAEAEKRNPNDATMKLAYANLDLANKDTAKALQRIKESIDLYPTRDAYLLRAQVQISQDRWNDAVTSLKQAILMDQSNAQLYVYLGVAYEKAGDMTNANQIYDLIKSRFQDGAQAIEQIKKTFSINPTVTDPESTAPENSVAPKTKR